jgi:hypothetical protein
MLAAPLLLPRHGLGLHVRHGCSCKEPGGRRVMIKGTHTEECTAGWQGTAMLRPSAAGWARLLSVVQTTWPQILHATVNESTLYASSCQRCMQAHQHGLLLVYMEPWAPRCSKEPLMML